MNANSFISPRMIVGAAIVGLVGAAGIFLYEQYAEKRRAMLVSEVARLKRLMASIRTDMEDLKELQQQSILHRVRPKPRVKRETVAPAGDATDSEYFTDCQSLIGSDIEMNSDEFYDVPSDDDDTLREPVANGQVSVDQKTTSEETKPLKDST